MNKMLLHHLFIAFPVGLGIIEQLVLLPHREVVPKGVSKVSHWEKRPFSNSPMNDTAVHVSSDGKHLQLWPVCCRSELSGRDLWGGLHLIPHLCFWCSFDVIYLWMTGGGRIYHRWSPYWRTGGPLSFYYCWSNPSPNTSHIFND